MLTAQSAARKDKTTGLSPMQHRHFATIAKIISLLHTTEGMGKVDQERVATHFADMLPIANPKFDRERFLRACPIACDSASARRSGA